MNYGRIVAAAIAGTIVDAVYGFVVYGTLLRGEFERYPNVYRGSDSGAAYLPVMFVAIFAGIIVLSFIYAKGYEGKGPGVSEGLRFGALVGLFVGAVSGGVSYGILNIGGRLATVIVCAAIVEWIAVGAAIGSVYRSSARARGASQRV